MHDERNIPWFIIWGVAYAPFVIPACVGIAFIGIRVLIWVRKRRRESQDLIDNIAAPETRGTTPKDAKP